MLALDEVQEAVYKALVAEPRVTALAAARVYDDVPHSAEGTSPAMPYIVIGDQSGTEAGSSDHDAIEITITLHTWSRAPGKRETLKLLSAINTALHKKSHAMASGFLVYLQYDGHETQKDQDGETNHGIIRFNGLLQYG